MRGFRNYGVDVFLKFGGSLLSDLGCCRSLVETLEAQAARHGIVVFPGGGPIDDYIESLNETLSFEPYYHHQLCARAQDQTGLVVASMTKRGRCFDELVHMAGILEDHKLAVMLPMKMIVSLDVFERSWDITSDSMALYFAHLVGARRFAVLTDVDGLLDDDDRLVENIDVEELAGLGHTVVDTCFAAAAKKMRRSAWVLNGREGDRVAGWIAEEHVRCTKISAE